MKRHAEGEDKITVGTDAEFRCTSPCWCDGTPNDCWACDFAGTNNSEKKELR